MAELNGAVPAAKCACGHYARIDEVGTFCRYCECTEHRASPYQGHDPQTPPGAEAALQTFSDDLEPARIELREAADAEVEAELTRDAARRKWLLSDECPQTGSFGGVRVTVAYRDAWVDDKIADEERAFRLAREPRKAAAKRLDILGKQGSFSQTLAKSVDGSYRGQRGEGW